MPNVFLLNANLSHESAEFLRSWGYTATTVVACKLGRAKDETIAHYAQRKGMIIITQDLDFGYMYYFTP